MSAHTSPAQPASAFATLAWLLLLAAGVLALKWPAFTQYVEQRHHLFSLSQLELPSIHLPGEIREFLAAQDREIVARQNALFFAVDRKNAPISIQPPLIAETASPSAAEKPTATPITLQAGSKVLFCGDSLMQGLAIHLNQALKKRKIAYKDLSRQSTGLAYPSFFDWPKTIREEIAAGNATLVVIFLGANDAWDMVQRGRFVRFNSEEWRTIYRERVASIARMSQEAGIRLIWIGLPPMEDKRLSNKAPILNALYEEVTRDYSNTLFLPASATLTEDGVSYTLYKRSPKGVNQRLRADDGIHLAPTGSRLLAEDIWRHVQFE